MDAVTAMRSEDEVAAALFAAALEYDASGSEYARGSADALRWVAYGGVSPVLGEHVAVADAGSVGRELRAVEDAVYDLARFDGRYVAGVESALRWSEGLTEAPPVAV